MLCCTLFDSFFFFFFFFERCASVAKYTLSLSVEHGVLTRSATSTVGKPLSSTRVLVVSGTLNEVTVALNNVHYDPDNNWWGIDRLYMSLSDGGYGSAPSQKGVSSMYFHVVAVNDVPEISLSPSVQQAPQGLFVISNNEIPLVGLSSCPVATIPLVC